MPLTKQKKYNTGTTVAILAILTLILAAYAYFCLYDYSLLQALLVDDGSPKEGVTSVAAARWLLTFVALIINWLLLRNTPKLVQMVVTILELFGLLVWYMSAFNMSLTYIADKVGYLIVQGAFTTLYITIISIICASAIALVMAIMKLSQSGILVGIARFYTSLFRGLPLLLQIFILYMGLPQFGIIIPPIPSGIVALSLCYGAYMSETFRAGIESVPHGQWEASTALGLHKRKIMRLVILPQAMKLIIPPTGNSFISMLKDSSLVSVVGIWELTYLASTLGTRDFRNMEMLVTAAAIYWIITMCLEFVQSRIERKFNVATRAS